MSIYDVKKVTKIEDGKYVEEEVVVEAFSGRRVGLMEEEAVFATVGHARLDKRELTEVLEKV